MMANKDKIRYFLLIVLAWLFALAMLYLVWIKLRILTHK
jgi:hypothetical protein